MRRLYPDPAEQVDLAEAYSVAAGRHLRVNFVESADGAVTLHGRSGGLSNQGDRQLFRVLRSLCDVVLVGAGTVRAENYGGVKPTDGDGSPARIAVVSRALDLDPSARVFAEATTRPIVLTVASAPPERQKRLGDVAEIVVAGEEDVDAERAVVALVEAGLPHVLCEGGPHLFGWLAAAGVVDELCLTLAPLLVGGPAGRIVAGVASEVGDELHLAQVLEDEGSLFLRYSVRTEAQRR
jgi:riboflavin biosynthesis pyrimidine reductase